VAACNLEAAIGIDTGPVSATDHKGDIRFSFWPSSLERLTTSSGREAEALPLDGIGQCFDFLILYSRTVRRVTVEWSLGIVGWTAGGSVFCFRFAIGG
jgi:hypothetical protein